MAKRKKTGGRQKHDPPLKKHLVNLTEDQARLLRAWGRGDLSAGLRWLVDAASVMVGKKKVEKSEEGGVDNDRGRGCRSEPD